MRPVLINGILWRVVPVHPGHPSLIDRTMTSRLATTDPVRKTIYIRQDIIPPFRDRILLHEVTHAITMSYNLLDDLHRGVPPVYRTHAEEWSANLVEGYAMEAIMKTTEILGRPLCIRGICVQGV